MDRLTALFNMLFKFNLVPTGFSKLNYQPLAKKIVSVQTCFHKFMNNKLSSDNLRFGFKKQSSCSKAIFALISAGTITLEMVQFFQKTAPTIATISVCLFLTRGHHWKPEYENIVNRIWQASNIGITPSFRMPDWDLLFRTGIHPFGEKMPHLVYVHWASLNKLPNTLVMHVNAALSGAALNCTAAAVIKIISGEGFFTEFEFMYERQIKGAIDEAIKIHGNPTACHINATLYGARSLHSTLDTDNATSLAAVLLGYVSSISKEAPISEQKMPNKSGDNNPGIVQRVENYSL